MLPEIITAIPGPKSLALAGELRRFESPNVTFLSPDFPVFWHRAEGTNVWDVDGNRFLDLTSGFGVSSLGYNHPRVVQAAAHQLSLLHHAMGDVHPALPKVELCRELSRLTYESWEAGTGKTILANSGAEAIEASLKSAFLATGKRGVLAFQGAYHGLGYGALTVSGLEEFRFPFHSQLADFTTFLPYPEETIHQEAIHEERWRQQLALAIQSNPIGAILVEPIQGRAGVIVPPDWFLPLLRNLATEFKVLLVLDEIYTGFYRTGTRFACSAHGVVPDLICLGKALTNGFPLAACVGKSEIMDRWPVSDGEALHTSTFLGNPLGCAMALAALAELELSHSDAAILSRGECWKNKLSKLELGPVRGRGLLVGIEIPQPELPGRIVVEGLKAGLILLTGGPHRNVLTLTPPFAISEGEFEFFLQSLERIRNR